MYHLIDLFALVVLQMLNLVQSCAIKKDGKNFQEYFIGFWAKFINFLKIVDQKIFLIAY